MGSDRVDFSPRGDEETADLYSTEHRFGYNEPSRGEDITTGNKYLDFFLGLIINFFTSWLLFLPLIPFYLIYWFW